MILETFFSIRISKVQSEVDTADGETKQQHIIDKYLLDA